MTDLIYKVVPRQLWEDAVADGAFQGAPVDIADGYIHFSTKAQLAVTIEKHFAGQSDLLLITVSADRLGELLCWEPSRGGDLFPHLYASLSIEAVVAVEPLN